ncbi:MAG: hypothetical protein U1D30_18745 [Planctomycetota bacterium]
MTDTPDSAKEIFDERDWAKEAFGARGAESVAAARGSLLRGLADSGFLPPPTFNVALRVLEQRDSADERRLHPTYESLRVGQEQFLQERLDKFTAAFFRLEPHERRTRWEALRAASADYPNLLARLRELEMGLDLRRPARALRDPQLSDLAQGILDIFVTTPSRQGLLRRKLLAEAEKDPVGWKTAARKLSLSHSAVAALDAPLVNELGGGMASPRALERQRKKLAKSAGQGESKWTWKSAILPVWFVLIFCAKMASNTTSSKSQYTEPMKRKPKIQVPDVAALSGSASPVMGTSGGVRPEGDDSVAVMLGDGSRTIPSETLLKLCVAIAKKPVVLELFDQDLQAIIRRASEFQPVTAEENRRLVQAMSEMLEDKDFRGDNFRNFVASNELVGKKEISEDDLPESVRAGRERATTFE